MKLNKTIGAELYSLFGPNGSNGVAGKNETRRLIALRELERHGLIKIEPNYEIPGILNIVRMTRGL